MQPDAHIITTLARLGDSALNTGDIPVAAILLYNNDVLGAGYNTVKRNRLAGGHAEINALTDAMSKTGVDSFMRLDREHLTLITTWEPCPMCKGSIIEYNIRHVIVLKTKTMSYWLKQWEKSLKYEWNKQAAITDTLQLRLFEKHPLYDQQKGKLNSI